MFRYAHLTNKETESWEGGAGDCWGLPSQRGGDTRCSPRAWFQTDALDSAAPFPLTLPDCYKAFLFKLTGKMLPDVSPWGSKHPSPEGPGDPHAVAPASPVGMQPPNTPQRLIFIH